MYVILIAAMLFVSATLAGIFTPPFQQGKEASANPNLYACCNTGDGKDCKPDPDVEPITYKGEKYGLLKSNVYLKNMNPAEHYDFAKQGNSNQDVAINGEVVLLNVIPEKKTQEGTTHPPFCDRPAPDKGFDWIYVKKDPRDDSKKDYSCQRIPDDMLLYLCRSDNPPGLCKENDNKSKVGLDVWIRLKDIGNSTIDEKYPFLANCFKPKNPEAGEQQIKFRPSPGGQDNLQLRTFKFTEPGTESEWLNPYCKPAIYLYPEQKTEINVTVSPKGKMLVTIPEYPKKGWDVIADPDGSIFYQNTRFDYLYYEASLPDQIVRKPEEGYVIPYKERATVLSDLVTRLGLNEKERKQFLEYWVPILPKSPYYFIGVVPQTELNEMSPVSITPKPKTFFRVTLYFQPLEHQEKVDPPLILPMKREGFTAIEWGGIVKRDKNHPFSCFM